MRRLGVFRIDDESVSLARARDLEARLAVLHERSLPRPLLTPHRDARSEDLLVAVSLLERIWQNGRGVTVVPTPAISAPARTSEPASR